MKRKIVSWICCVAMMCAILPAPILADEMSGTEQVQNLIISTPEELVAFADAVNDGAYNGKKDVVVSLVNDIDMSGVTWTPIGVDDEHYFSGTFDGNGHTLQNLTMSPSVTSFTGLFGITDATIQNVSVEGQFSVNAYKGQQYIGGIAGYASGAVVERCTVNIENDLQDSSGYYFMGGVIGIADNATVKNCTNNGRTSLKNVAPIEYGGIVGWAVNGATISYCTNNGQILCEIDSENAISNAQVAGVVSNIEEGSASINHCTNNGNIDATANSIGGIVATVNYLPSESATLIDNCLNKGNLTMTKGPAKGGSIGGITAYLRSTGEGQTYTLSNNISTGTIQVPGSQSVGAIVATIGGSGYIFVNNHYDESIPSTTLQPEGNTSHSKDEMSTPEFIDNVNNGGGDYSMDSDGEMIVKPLEYALTVNDSYADVTGAGSYEAGAQVAIDAGVRDGYSFAGWTSAAGSFADASAAQTTFTMPAGDVTLTAHWEKISEPPYTGKYSYEIFTDESKHGDIDVDRYATEGEKVTVTLSPEDGYAPESVTITTKSGKEIDVTDNGDGTYSFKMPSGDVTIAATFAEAEKPEPTPELPFIDVSEGDWFYDPVAWAYEEGLMTGTSATEFSPNLATTRGMIVSILHRLEGAPTADAAGFDDVADGAWYADAVNWAASEDIVAGMSADTFAPNDPITREQLAAILYNYAAYKGMDVSKRADLSGYTDAASISEWAEDVLSWANAEGLVNGMTETTLTPQGNATRAQVAAIFQRFLTK